MKPATFALALDVARKTRLMDPEQAASVIGDAIAERDRRGRAKACEVCAAGQPAGKVNGLWWHEHEACKAGPIRDLE